MSEPTPPPTPSALEQAANAEADDLDGHTIEELSDYLDRGGLPPDESIETSARCQLALASLQRLRSFSASWLETAAATEPERDDSWVTRILQHISVETHAGRDIPLAHDSEGAQLAITEGAVRGMIRAVGDRHEGLVIGRCRIEGDVTIAGTPITITIDASVFWGDPIPDTVARVRAAIADELEKHTEMVIAGIDITVHDIELLPSHSEEDL